MESPPCVRQNHDAHEAGMTTRRRGRGACSRNLSGLFSLYETLAHVVRTVARTTQTADWSVDH
jgi:hypothetical protein